MAQPSLETKPTAVKYLVFLRSILLYGFMFIVVSVALDLWRARELPKGEFPVAQYQSIDGEAIDLASMSREGVTVLYVWATWCGPCKVTTPSMKQLAQHFPVVSIAMASGSDEALKAYQSEHTFNYPVINDNDQVISNAWSVAVTPSILLLKDGKIVAFTTGISTYPGLLLRAWWLRFSLHLLLLALWL